MNFKPSWKKVVVSLILAVVIVLLFTILSICLTFGCYGISLGGIFEPYLIYIMIAVAVVIYVIWSLFKKK